jgi:uncharacterized protein YqgC (DUF456 family)
VLQFATLESVLVLAIRTITWWAKTLLLRSLILPDSLGGYMKNSLAAVVTVALCASLAGCAGGSLSTREKGAGIGALGGATVGGIIGAAVGHPGAGAAIGGALGLGSGALVGDQLQGQEQRQSDQQRQIDTNQTELDRQRRELETLKKQGEYWAYKRRLLDARKGVTWGRY